MIKRLLTLFALVLLLNSCSDPAPTFTKTFTLKFSDEFATSSYHAVLYYDRLDSVQILDTTLYPNDDSYTVSFVGVRPDEESEYVFDKSDTVIMHYSLYYRFYDPQSDSYYVNGKKGENWGYQTLLSHLAPYGETTGHETLLVKGSSIRSEE